MLLVIGDANADAAARTVRFPLEGEDVTLEDFGWSSGGAGVNVATAFARLGGEARLVARIGGDPTGGIALAAAARAGVDLAFVERDPERTTGVCFVLVSWNAERTFLSHRGANAFLAPPGPAVWEGVRRVHVCGHALMRSPQRATTLGLVAEAGARGLPVSLDLCLPVIWKYGTTLYEHFPLFDVVFTNEAELWRLAFGPNVAPSPDDFDGAVERLKAGGARTLVVKRGALGSVVVRESAVTVAPFEVRAVDSTGAGDAFVAAFLVGTIAGQGPEAAARFGNAAGALQAARVGSADVLPARAEVVALAGETRS